MTPLHERLAIVALTAAARFDFALAGCHALRAHGLGERPSPDMELLTPRVNGVTEAVPAVTGALTAAGFDVIVELAGGSFARMRVREPQEPPPGGGQPGDLASSDRLADRSPIEYRCGDSQLGRQCGRPSSAGNPPDRATVGGSGAATSTKIKLCVDQRAYPPMPSPLGPVLSADDAVAGTMFALLGRHLAEDFVDVDLVLRSGLYTRDDLLRLALRHDRGFQAAFFCEALAALRFVPDIAFAPYGLTQAEIGALRARFAHWQRELISSWLSSSG
jgi:hypothetical protein